jgi:integrase
MRSFPASLACRSSDELADRIQADMERKAAGLPHRRIYDMRHTFATWSVAAGMSIFTLSRRMGTSVEMIDRTYGHLAQDSADQDRDLLDAYDGDNGGGGHALGTNSDEGDACDGP